MKHSRTRCILVGLLTLITCAALPADNPAPDWKGNVDAGADKSLRPIVFVHGFGGSGEQYELPARLFASNGYPPSWIANYDYNSTGATGGAAPLDKFIDAVRMRTGFDKVDLVGHSRGTMVSQDYLADPARAAKVAHYANIAGRPSTNVGGVPTLVVGSKGDKIAGPGAVREGAKHVVLEKPDHVEAATGPECFEKVYTFFNDGKAPKTLKITPQEPIAVAGFAKLFGPNTPLAGATVEVYAVAADTGRRLAPKPLAQLTVRQDGAWGPFQAKTGQHYEFCLHTPGNARPMHYYREPFVRTDLLVYLKMRDEKSEPGASVVRDLHLSDDSSILIVSQLNGAIAAGKDSLKINDVEIATPEIAPAAATKVGFYVFDANQNKKTDATHPAGPNWNLPFISAADVYIPTDKPDSVKLEFNGHVLHVPNWKPASEGLIAVAFD